MAQQHSGDRPIVHDATLAAVAIVRSFYRDDARDGAQPKVVLFEQTQKLVDRYGEKPAIITTLVMALASVGHLLAMRAADALNTTADALLDESAWLLLQGHPDES